MQNDKLCNSRAKYVVIKSFAEHSKNSPKIANNNIMINIRFKENY